MRKSKAPLLPATWEVPAEFRERLGETVGRQRLMSSEGHLLLVTHKPPKPDEDERQPRLFWRQPDGTWASSDGGGPGAIAKHLGEFSEMLESFENLEHDAARADEYFAILEGLAPLHRAIRNLYAVLQEARQSIPDDRDLINFRDQAYELDRRSELLHSVTKNGLDFAVALRAEEQSAAANDMASAAHRLNILAAFFFPLATLSSIFGMTMLDQWKSGELPPMSFLLVIGVGVFMGFGLHSWVIQRKTKT